MSGKRTQNGAPIRNRTKTFFSLVSEDSTEQRMQARLTFAARYILVSFTTGVPAQA
jgi:hypothetical protein